MTTSFQKLHGDALHQRCSANARSMHVHALDQRFTVRLSEMHVEHLDERFTVRLSEMHVEHLDQLHGDTLRDAHGMLSEMHGGRPSGKTQCHAMCVRVAHPVVVASRLDKTFTPLGKRSMMSWLLARAWLLYECRSARG
jgi:hypothetical protein